MTGFRIESTRNGIVLRVLSTFGEYAWRRSAGNHWSSCADRRLWIRARAAEVPAGVRVAVAAFAQGTGEGRR